MIFYDNNKFKYINKIKKSNGGFTLVEMVVTLVVLAIIMALSAMGILAWQDWSRFNQANEYAQTLFVASQNQLSEYETTGKLTDFEERLKKSGVYSDSVDLSSIYYEEGKNYTEDSVWISENKGKVCYAKCQSGDYEKYVNGEDISASSKIVFELLEEYVFDPSILNNPICVEFSAEDAQVFSVSFSDANTSFIYSDSDTLRGEVSISNRWESYRRDRMVGYYGVDTLSSTTKYGKPVIAKVKLNNEETLNLSFKLSKYAYATKQLVYDIDIYDKEATNKPKLKLSIDGSLLKNYDYRSAIECDVTRYNYVEDSIDEEYLGSVPVLAWVENDKTVRVVFDAADFQATSALYESEIDLIKSDSMASTNFSDTYSFHRFGIDADEIYCTVKAHGANYRTSAKKTSNKSNVYFAGSKKELSEDVIYGNIEKRKYTIKNGRHLYNVRYIEDVADNYSSEIKNYMPTLQGDICYFEYKILNDIDWNEFVASGNYYDSNGILMADVNDSKVSYNPDFNIKTFATNYFPSYKRLRAGDIFYSEDKVIKNIYIAQLNNDLQGIYIDDSAEPEGGNGSNNEDNSSNSEERDVVIKPTGLFAYNYGDIHNIILDEIVVEGENHVGAFCGDNAGFLSELKVDNTGEKSVIFGVTNVGGLVGYNIGVADEIVLSKLDERVVTIDKLENNAPVIGDVYVGGIIGTAKLSSDCDIIIEISDCKNFGRIETSDEKEKDETAYIGGILGFVANYYGYNENAQVQNIDEDRIKVFDCVFGAANTTFDFDEYVTDSDNIPEVILDKMKGKYVGGIVGFNYHGTIQNCGSDSELAETATLYGYEYVGGIVGFNQGKILGASADAEDIFDNNKTNVIGYNYVGGIVGCNADIETALSEEDNIGEDYVEVEVSEDKNLNIKVSDMDNSAIVYALEGYAGGITGYNKGWLYNSLINVDDEDEGKVYSKEYAGGIAGYNNGLIGDTKRIIDDNDFSNSTFDGTPNAEENKVYIRPFVVGNNYVGGVAGYNDEDATIEDYNVSKGHVRGNNQDSFYVGGYVGLNTSVDLLMDETGKEREYVASLEEVSGQYFVGGYIGGNIINTKKYKDEGGNTQPVEPEQPVDPVDPEPEEPVDPNPPVKPDEPAIEGAYGSLVPQGDVRSDEEWDYATVNLKVVNNTDVTIKMYEVDFSEAPYEFEVNSPWGIIYNEDTKIARLDKDYWISILPGESNSTPGFNIKAKKGQLEAILKKNFIIKIIQDGVLSANNSINAEKEPFELEIRHKHHWWESGVVNQGTAHGQYNIYITKNSPDYYKNWRIEIDLKDGQVLEANHATIARQEGNKIIISNESYNGDFTNSNTVMFEIQIRFDKQVDIDNFVNAHYVLHVGDGNGNDDAYVYDSDNDNKEDEDTTADEDTPDSDLPDSEVGIPEIPEGIVAKYQSDKVASQINATAFVGGYFGYNLFVSNNGVQGRIYTDEVQKAIITKVKQQNTLSDKYNLVNNIENTNLDISQPINKSSVTFVLNGDIDNQNDITSVDSIVAGDICVGGVIGFNAKDTKLYVRNMRDYSSVVARESLTIDEQYGRTVDYNNKPIQYEYSYVGGITGKVLDSTVLDNCSVDASVNVSTNGTYIGGLCEINNGRVVRCSSGNIGDSSRNYIGGIVGLNNKNGVVSYCSILDSTITGKNVVGGVAAENLGTIYKTNVSKIKIDVNGEETSFVDASGTSRIDGVCGAITAYNSENGRIYLGCDLNNVEINSKGYYVGGVVGVNHGRLSSVRNKNSYIQIGGYVIGLGDVGGVIGKNISTTDSYVRYYLNKAVVSTTAGDAGGIIGNNSANSKVLYCDNEGMVSAAGNAGGIVADNYGLIKKCNDYVAVTSQNGFSGGITARNYSDAKIINCSVSPKRNSDGNYISDEKIEFSSKSDAGGITAYNDGTISGCTVSKLDVYNYGGEAGDAGAVAGVNNGSITLAKGLVIDDCLVGTMSNDSNVGGVVGINSSTGVIRGFEWTNIPSGSEDASVIKCKIELKNDAANIANMGGVSGKNLGRISYCSVNGDINGNLGDANTGVGGIAGINGGEADSVSVIEYCSFDGKGYANGSNQSIANLGGMTGINYENSSINKCYIALFKDTSVIAGKDNTSVSNTGGLVGTNYGEIKDCDNYNNTKAVAVSGYGGYQGGIVGRNEVSGKIVSTTADRLSTNNNWTIISYNNSNTSASGGIAGYYVVGGDLSKVDNYATIAAENCHGDHNATSGGIIGILYNPTATNYKVSNCINYGEVRSGARAGGIVGTVSMNGLSFERCTNFGKISSEKSGGIVSCITNVSKDDEVIFDGCINHGELSSNTYPGGSGCKAIAGGILAKANGEDSNTKVYFADCINTGCISGNVTLANRGGIVAETGNNGYFYSCRSYGTGDRSGMCAMGEKNSGFLFWGRRQDNEIINCIDFCGYTGFNLIGDPQAAPMNNADTIRNCYYINRYSDDLFQIVTGFYEGLRGAGTRLKLRRRVQATTYEYYITGSSNAITNVKYNFSDDSYKNDNSDYYTSLASKVRIPAYLDADSNTKNFIYMFYDNSRTLSAPTGLKGTVTGGNYRFEWNESTDTSLQRTPAYCYEIMYEVKDDAGNDLVDFAATKQMIYGRRFYELPIKDEWFGSKIIFYVRAVSGNELRTGDTSSSSNFANSTTNTINTLRAPMVHFEYIDEENLVAVLDNKEEYIGEDDEFIDCDIQVEFDDTVVSIDPVEGYSSNKIKYNNNEDIINISAIALANDGDDYSNSVETNYDTTLVAIDKKESNEKYDVSFDGFYENNDDGFAYKLIVNNHSASSDKIVNTDIITFDNELGCDVSYSSVSTKIMPSAEAAVFNYGLLDDYIGKNKFKIINYLWSSDENGIVYGHIVGTGIKKYELSGFVDKNFYVTNNGKCELVDNDIWEHDKKGNNTILKPGYIIRANEDDTYEVIYSSILANDIDSTSNLYEKTYSLSGNGRGYVSEDENIMIQPSPYIENTLTYESGKAVITWDKNKNGADYENAVYSIKLNGNSGNMDYNFVEEARNIEQNQYNFELNNIYPIYEIVVSRVGEIDDEGRITKFPSFATRSFVNSVKLSQIDVLSANLKDNGELATDTDAIELRNEASQINDVDNRILYEISWEPISSLLENSDCGGYVIKVESFDEKDKSETRYYNIRINNNDYELDGINASDVSDTYVTGKIVKAVIDLSDYRDGEKLSISVMAKASKKAIYYMDGEYGKGIEIDIPVRLPVPSATDFSNNWNTVNEIDYNEMSENGLVISYSNEITEMYQEVDGTYQYAIALYDEEQAKVEMQGSVSSVKHGDAIDNQEGYWNSKALKTFVSKRECKTIPGGINEGAVQLNSTPDGSPWADYAGMWLKVVVKAKNGKGVSSLWSDEDGGDETDDYLWIKIPKVKLSAPKIESEEHCIKIKTDKYSDGYVLALGSDYESLIDECELYFKKNNNMSYDLYGISANQKVSYDSKITEEYLDEYANYKKYYGRLDLTSTKLEFDYVVNSSFNSNRKLVKGTVVLDGEDIVVNMPYIANTISDNNTVDLADGNTHTLVSEQEIIDLFDYVSVRSIVVDKKRPYGSSDIKLYNMNTDELNILEVVEADKKSINDVNISFDEKNITLIFESSVICGNVIVRNEDGRVVWSCYEILSNGKEKQEENHKKQLVLDRNSINNGVVSMRFKTIDADGNVSDWSAVYELKIDNDKMKLEE